MTKLMGVIVDELTATTETLTSDHGNLMPALELLKWVESKHQSSIGHVLRLGMDGISLVLEVNLPGVRHNFRVDCDALLTSIAIVKKDLACLAPDLFGEHMSAPARDAGNKTCECLRGVCDKQKLPAGVVCYEAEKRASERKGKAPCGCWGREDCRSFEINSGNTYCKSRAC